jgi:hypothetical protein
MLSIVPPGVGKMIVEEALVNESFVGATL